MSQKGQTKIVNYAIYMVLLIFMLILPFIYSAHFFLNMMILIFMWTLCAVAWNILGGFVGQYSFGHGAFFGIGAYTTTLLFLHLWLSPWYGMIIGATLAAIVGIGVGYLTFRLRGHYFVLFTLAFSEILRVIFLNWDFVGGSWGLKIPALSETTMERLVNFQFYPNKIPYYYIFLGILIFEVIFVYKLKKSKAGYYFIAIREDDTVAECSGINTVRYKVIAFALSAFFTAIGGAMYTVYTNFIDPEITMHIFISTQMVLGPVIGGVGTVFGPIVGTFLLLSIGEYMRAYIGGLFRGVYLMLYGAILMVMVIFKPEGLMAIIQPILRKLGYKTE